MKNFILSIFIFYSCFATGQNPSGTWNILDGLIIVDFRPDGILSWDLPVETLTPDDGLNPHYETTYSISKNTIYFTVPEDTAHYQVDFTYYTDSIHVVHPDGIDIMLMKTVPTQSEIDPQQVERLLISKQVFTVIIDGELYEYTFFENAFFENGIETSGTWKTFRFFGNIFLLFDFGDGYLEFYRIRSLNENSVLLSRGDFEEESETGLKTMTTFYMLEAKH